MSWSDWEYVWKRQKPPVGKNAEIASLLETYEAKRRKTATAIMARDYAEAGAGIIVSIAIGFLIWKAKKFVWIFAVALLLIIAVTAFFIRERIRARRRRLGPDAAMLARLEADLAELRRQRHLLWNLALWYILPIGLSWALVLLGINRNRAPARRDPLFLSVYVGFCLILFWLGWLMNRRAVRKRLDPRIEELEKLREHLTTGDGPP